MHCSRASLALAAVAMLATAAQAQDWPAKPVKIVVPFSAGGSSDQLARLITPELSAAFKQQFYVENRAGSSGALGSAQVAVECKGLTIVASGDYKDAADPTCAPFASYTPKQREFSIPRATVSRGIPLDQ